MKCEFKNTSCDLMYPKNLLGKDAFCKILFKVSSVFVCSWFSRLNSVRNLRPASK